jgi:alanyl-tRNA synthetase
VNLPEIVEGLPPTVLTYHKEPYAAKAEGRILRAVKEQGANYYVVLASTIFHPKGGGQPSDTGTLKGEAFTMQVKKALKAGDHVILYGKCARAPTEGPCTQELEWGRRLLYMRRHTAAHLFDGVLAQATSKSYEPLDSWLGDDAYVAYRGEPPDEAIMARLAEAANGAISEGRAVTIDVVKPENLTGLRQFWSDALQGQREIRLVRVKGFDPIPCAGTHVKNLKDVRGVRIIATERTTEGFRIHFDVAPVE